MKPLNPFLGELFIGKWTDEQAGTTHLVTEQVSHHPPITAYNIWNDKHGIRVCSPTSLASFHSKVRPASGERCSKGLLLKHSPH